MNCYTCRTSRICKVFEMVQSHKDSIAIDISRCNHYHQAESTGPVLAGQPPYPVEDTSNRARPIEEISTVAARIKELYDRQEVPAENPNVLAAEPEIEKKNCPECGSPSTTICSHCELPICEDCLVQSASDNKVYCSGCWDKI